MDTLKEIEGEIFGKHIEWGNIDKEKALANTKILDLLREACLIESFFGVYIGHMMELFGYDVEATSMFTIEAFEAQENRLVSAGYCGEFESREEAKTGCSLTRGIEWDASKINDLCAGGIEGGI